MTLVMPQVEMGQGVYTSIPMILAEELDVSLEHVVLEHAPPNDKLYGNPTFGLQVTGNSNSIRAFWTPLRKAGAGARAMLVQAAAKTWHTDPAGCRTERGEVIHDSSGKRLAYSALVDQVAGQTPPADPPLKAVNSFKLIGQPLKRFDTPDKVNGKTQYSIDVRPPGVKIATLVICPSSAPGWIGSMIRRPRPCRVSVRSSCLDDAVAVVGDHMWAAKRGVDALDIVWKSGPHAAVDTDEVWKQLRAADSQGRGCCKVRWRCRAALTQGDRFEADYRIAVSGTCDHGASELHSARSAGQLRGLGRLASTGSRAKRCRPGDRPAASRK